jgi:hypothetical protein
MKFSFQQAIKLINLLSIALLIFGDKSRTLFLELLGLYNDF